MLRVLSLFALLALAAPGSAADTADAARRPAALDHFRRGVAAMGGEDWDTAIEELHTAIRIDPRLVEAHYALGRSYMATHRYERAVSAYQACRAAYLAEEGARVASDVHAEQAQDEEVRELRRSLQRIESGQIPADLLTRMRIETRIGELERLRRRDPVLVEVPAELSLALGSAYYRAGDVEQAEKEYLAALHVRPGLGEAHNNLAVVYMVTGRLGEARAELAEAEKAGFRVPPGLRTELADRP